MYYYNCIRDPEIIGNPFWILKNGVSNFQLMLETLLYTLACKHSGKNFLYNKKQAHLLEVYVYMYIYERIKWYNIYTRIKMHASLDVQISSEGAIFTQTTVWYMLYISTCRYIRISKSYPESRFFLLFIVISWIVTISDTVNIWHSLHDKCANLFLSTLGLTFGNYCTWSSNTLRQWRVLL